MPEENWVHIEKEKVFYRKKGAGNPVMLIHGFAEDGAIWERQIDFLQPHFQLIIPDLPGSGKSGFIHLSIDGHAEIIKQIIDQEKIKTCTMAGHSMGGYITLAFAGKYPERLNAFSLVHSTAYADSEEKKTARKKSIEFIKKNGAAEFIKQSSPNLFSDFTKANHPEMIRELIQTYDNFKPHALVSYYEAMMQRPDKTEVLRNFKKPIQFIIGEQDNAVPLDQSLKQCNIPEISYIHILENTGHMGMWEASDKTNNFLFAFINSATA